MDHSDDYETELLHVLTAVDSQPFEWSRTNHDSSHTKVMGSSYSPSQTVHGTTRKTTQPTHAETDGIQTTGTSPTKQPDHDQEDDNNENGEQQPITDEDRKTLVAQLQELLEKEKKLMNMKVIAKDQDLARLEQENQELRQKMSQLGHPYKENADDTENTGPVRVPISIRKFSKDVFEQLTSPYRESVHPEGPSILDLTNDKLSQARDIPATVEACLNVPGIEGVDFRNSSVLSDQDVPKLCEIFSRFPNVKFVSLADNPALGKSSAKALSQWLPRLPNLKSIDLSGNWFNGYSFSVPPDNISNDFVDGLGTIITTLKKCSQIQFLSISVCDDFANDVLEESATLKNAAPTEDTKKPGGKQQGKRDAKKSSTKRRTDTGNKTSKGSAGKAGSSRHLVESLGSMSSLRGLSLRGSHISSLGFSVLLAPEKEIQEQNENEKSSDKTNSKPQAPDKTNSKTRSKGKSGPSAVEKWMETLQRLLHLDLSFTYMGWRGIRHLLKGLGYSLVKTRKELCRIPSLQSLDLRGCSLQDATAYDLLTALMRQKDLKRIDLKYNNVSDRGIIHLAKQVRQQGSEVSQNPQNFNLRVVDVRNNSFGHDAASELCDAVTSHPKVVHVTSDGVSANFMFRDNIEDNSNHLEPIMNFRCLWECPLFSDEQVMNIQESANDKDCKLESLEKPIRLPVSKLYATQTSSLPVFGVHEGSKIQTEQRVFKLTAGSTCEPAHQLSEPSLEIKHILQWRMSFGISGYAITGKQMAHESVDLHFAVYFRDLGSANPILLQQGTWKKSGAPSIEYLRSHDRVSYPVVEPSVLGMWYDRDLMSESDPSARFAVGWPYKWFRIELDPKMLDQSVWNYRREKIPALYEIGTFELRAWVEIDGKALQQGSRDSTENKEEQCSTLTSVNSDSIKLPKAAAESVCFVGDAEQGIEGLKSSMISKELSEILQSGMLPQTIEG